MEDKKVIVYSTPTCHFCHAAKDFFTKNNVPFEEFDVSVDEERRNEMVEKSGQMGVPVILIGDEAIVGFDEAKIKELLGL
jgi:glutaredoxin 3